MTKCVLGDVAKRIQTGPFGSQLHQSDYSLSGTPVVMPKDLSDGTIVDATIARVGPLHVERLARHKLKEGDLLFSRRGDVGRCALVRKEQEGWLCGTGCLRVELDVEKADYKYLYYFLRRDDVAKWLESHAVGAIMLNINPSIVSQLPVVLPSLDAQHNIAKVLSTIDRKIALNRKRIATLEAMAKEIYDYWFVQFDFPDAHGRPYKSSGGAMVYNPDLKREIPKGWEIKTVGDIANVVTGKEDANFAKDNGIYPFFTCSQKVLKCDEYKFDGKNVLVAGNGEFCVKHYIGKCNAYQRTYVISPLDVSYWGAIYIEAQRAIDRFKRCSSGSIVKFITMGDVRGLIVYCPVNIDLYDPINQCMEQIENQEREIVELSALRDFLLPLLMNGQVKVG